MKPRFIIILLLFITYISNAQDIQFNFSGGYAISPFKQTVEGYYNTKIDEIQTFKTVISKSFSLGAGFFIDGGLQFGFHENIALGLDFAYLHGQKIKFSQEDAISTVISVTEQELFGKSIRLIPSIIIRTEENTLRPYLKLGFILSKTMVELHEKISIYSDVTLREWEYKARGANGISFAGGLSYYVQKNTAFFFEINYQAIKYKPTESFMIKATENGNNILDSYLTIEKSITYASHIDQEYNMTPTPTKPQLLHEIYFPYSSLIFNVGVQIGF